MTRGEFISIATMIIMFALFACLSLKGIDKLNTLAREERAGNYTPQETTAAETTTAEETTPEKCTDNTSLYVSAYTEREKDLLVKVAYLEARGQGVEGLALVMNVILNRANKSGLTVEQVIFSPGQFAVVDMLDGCTPTAEAYEALELVMNGHDLSQGALYFCTPAANSWHKSHLIYLFTYGGHEFYK